MQFPFCFLIFFNINVCTTPSLLWYCAFLNVFFVKLLWWLIIFLIKMGFQQLTLLEHQLMLAFGCQEVDLTVTKVFSKPTSEVSG